MAYKYTHFIPQSTAPNGAKSIGVYNGNGEKVGTVLLGRLTPITKEKLYSFGLMADIHLWKVTPNWQANYKLDSALNYFQKQGCIFCAHCGDLTDQGFYIEKYTDGVETDTGAFDKYREICVKYTIPVYGICGNHESYNRPIRDTLSMLEEYTTELEELTGVAKLSYTIEQGNDVFIFCGQPVNNAVMSDEDLQWLYETLEANRNKRCFVFVHSFIPNDSGNALSVQTNSIFKMWGETKTTAFKNLLTHYKNIVLFHGHSHMKFICQELDESANYTEKNGFKSVHIPSLSRPRDVANGASINDDKGSEGYIVDVYDDCIVLNGMDFISEQYVPLGVFKINTTLQNIEANTFVDSTGTIIT